MSLTCPQCAHSIDVAEATAKEVVCPSCGSQVRREQETTEVWNPETTTRSLGKFLLIDQVGTGAFGNIYKARDPELNRIVAIKVPRAGNLATRPELDRFLREARSVAQLRHPAIVPVYEVGQAGDVPFLVSEFVQGVTLADRLTGTKLDARQAADLIAAIADALEYAHHQGIIHRDVKPTNIMLDDRDQPHVMDFGLAKCDGAGSTMTVEGQVLGTPAYMSPEQARGEAHQVDGRSDVYSLGVVLYQMLSGKLPFQGNPRMIMHQVIHDEPAPLRSHGAAIPRDLATICLKAMAKEPARRYATAKELADDLRRWRAGESIVARPPGVGERVQRWVKRRRDIVAASAFFFLAGGIFAFLLVLSNLRNAPNAVERTTPATSRSVQEKEPDLALPADLALIPEDAAGILALHVADFMLTDGFKKLNQVIAANGGGADDAFEFLADELKLFGVKPVDLRRASVVLLDLPPFDPQTSNFEEVVRDEMCAIYAVARPYDRAKVLGSLGDKPTRETRGGREFFCAANPASPFAICLIDDHVFIQSAPVAMRKLLDRIGGPRQPGPLRDALRIADEKHLLVIGCNWPKIAPSMREFAQFMTAANPSNLSLFESAEAGLIAGDVQFNLVPDDFTVNIPLDIRVRYSNEEQARRGRQAFESILSGAHQGLQRLIVDFFAKPATSRDNVPAEIGPTIGRFSDFISRWELALRAAKDTVNCQGQTVSVRINLGVDLMKLAQRWQEQMDDTKRGFVVLYLTNVFEAMDAYERQNHHLPPPAIYGKNGEPLLSWRVALLPFLGQKELYAKFKLDEPWDSPHNAKLVDAIPTAYSIFGDANKVGTTRLQVFVGPGSLFEGRDGIRWNDVPDGRDKTILLVEAADPVPWTKPADLPFIPGEHLAKLGSLFRGGYPVLFADGQIRIFPYDTKVELLRSLITRNGNEAVDLKLLPKPVEK